MIKGLITNVIGERLLYLFISIFNSKKSELFFSKVEFMSGYKIIRRYLTGSLKFKKNIEVVRAEKVAYNYSNAVEDNIDVDKTWSDHPNIISVNLSKTKMRFINLTHSKKFNGKKLLCLSNNVTYVNKITYVDLTEESIDDVEEMVSENFIRNESISYDIEFEATSKINKMTNENFQYPVKEETVQEFLKNLK